MNVTSCGLSDVNAVSGNGEQTVHSYTVQRYRHETVHRDDVQIGTQMYNRCD